VTVGPRVRDSAADRVRQDRERDRGRSGAQR
jgi:hypothetical protein